MMNEPAVLEASRVLAQKLVSEKSTTGEKITKAFRSVVCRRPSAGELSLLKKYYEDQVTLFRSKKLNAQATLQVGEHPLDEKIDLNMSAALMKLVNTLYNMDETITKS